MKFFRKQDIYIIAILLAVSLLFWVTYEFFLKDRIPKAEIYYYSDLVRTVELGQGIDKQFTIEESPGVIFHLFEDGSICFEESDCPHQLCVKAGKISKPGQFAACLPNGVILKIVATEEKPGDVDIIIGN